MQFPHSLIGLSMLSICCASLFMAYDCGFYLWIYLANDCPTSFCNRKLNCESVMVALLYSNQFLATICYRFPPMLVFHYIPPIIRVNLGKFCGNCVLLGRCWTSCNLSSRQNLTASRRFSSIVYFFNLFPRDFAHSVFFLSPPIRSWNWQVSLKWKVRFPAIQRGHARLLVFCAYFACHLKCKRLPQSVSFLAGSVAYSEFRYSVMK